MNLECPSCHASYEVPDDRLGPRRIVRCGTCDHKWAVGTRDPHAAHTIQDDAAAAPPDSPATVAPAPVANIVGPDQRLAPARTVPHRDMALTSAWVASVAAVVLLGSAAYAWRGNVVSAWPPSGRILGYAPKVVAVLEGRADQATGHADASTAANGGATGRRD